MNNQEVSNSSLILIADSDESSSQASHSRSRRTVNPTPRRELILSCTLPFALSHHVPADLLRCVICRVAFHQNVCLSAFSLAKTKSPVQIRRPI